MAFDEYIYGKFSNLRKKKKKKELLALHSTVLLDEIKSKLTLIARAVTGDAIDIYPAEREGGYKNNNFFLPAFYFEFDTYKENEDFFIFRILYLSFQKLLKLNWQDEASHSLDESRQAAQLNSKKPLQILFDEFPASKRTFEVLIEKSAASQHDKKPADYSYIFGKWMRNDAETDSEIKRKDFNEKLLAAIKKEEIETILKANPVEEMITLEVDKKQQEDYVMTHNFEKIETAEEHEGGWRDFDGDDDLKKHEHALDELNMKFTVRVDDVVHSVYKAEFVENTSISESSDKDEEDNFIFYDEWDYSKNLYKENYCKVFLKSHMESDISFYKNTITNNASTLLSLRKMLTSLNNKYQQQRRQTQGEEFDIDSLTDLFIDVHSRHTPTDKIYLSKRKREKDLSILLLLDMSLSSDSYAAGNKVIDVEKQISILFGEILNEQHVDFSINGFYSKTRNHSSYVTIKDFDENWNKAKYKIGTIEPNGYTRIGPAIRHSGAMISRRDTKNKWIILISDGKPNDYDKYEGKYGIYDVKQALRELNQNNVNSYALAIEAQAKYYLPQMFGTNHYEILTTPVELLKALAKLYDKIKYKT